MAIKPIYLIVTPFYPTEDNWRGSFVEDFARAVYRTGDWDVRVMLLDPLGTIDDFESSGIAVYSLPYKRLPGLCFPMFYAKENINSFNRVLDSHGIPKSDVAVLHVHTAICSIYAQGMDCVCLEHHHDCESFGLHLGWLRWSRLYRTFERRILGKYHGQFSAHVFISELVKRNFEFAWAQKASGYTLYNGVDKRIFPRREKNSTNERMVLGCVGNFEKGNVAVCKNQDLLIRALESVENVEVRFIGSGETLKACQRLAGKLGVVCRWDSERRHEELAAWYKELDLFVLPSSVEGFGCVALEAAACGVPFICSDSAGVAELVCENRDRWVFKSGDCDDLRSKIVAWRETRLAQKVVEFDIDILVAKFNEYVKGLVKDK